MKSKALAPLFLLSILLAGCSTTVPAPWGPPGLFGFDYYNDTDKDFQLVVDFGIAPGDFVDIFQKHSGASGSGPDCSNPNYPNWAGPRWMKVTLRDLGGNESVYGNLVGPIVFEGNWTGLQCQHTYVFHLIDSNFAVEVYEKESLIKKTWPCCDRGYTIRGKDLERVPP